MSLSYTLISNFNGVFCDTTGARIPADQTLGEWNAYERWLAQGNTPNPAAEPPPQVYTCALWQLRAVLTADQWTAAQGAITASNNPALSAYFEHGGNSIPSDSPTLIALGQAIGLSSEQVADAVRQASQVSIP